MNEFEKLQHQKVIAYQKKKCLTCSGVFTLSKARLKQFYEAMLDPTISSQVISEVLRGWGVASSESTINAHRRGKDNYAQHMSEIKKAAGVD